MHPSTIILVGIGILLVLLAVSYLGRQLIVARHAGSFECTLARRSLVGREVWQLGMMRFGTDRLRWFRAVSLRVRPEESLLRRDIRDLHRTPLEDADGQREPSVLVELIMADGARRRMILSASAASGMMAWLEGAPVGSIVAGID